MAKRVFKKANQATKYLEDILEKSTKEYLSTVSEQLYKDSEELTYIDSKEMYKSGELYSDFENGLIVERIPYVRRRYYEGGKAGAGNPRAVPHWFEETFKLYKNDYENQYKNIVEKVKKEV